MHKPVAAALHQERTRRVSVRPKRITQSSAACTCACDATSAQSTLNSRHPQPPSGTVRRVADPQADDALKALHDELLREVRSTARTA